MRPVVALLVGAAIALGAGGVGYALGRDSRPAHAPPRSAADKINWGGQIDWGTPAPGGVADAP